MKTWGYFRIGAFWVTAFIVSSSHFMGFGAQGIYYFSALSGALLMSHYIMGFYFSYPKLKHLFTFKSGRIAVFLCIAISLLGFNYEPELLSIIFGIHFAFSEAYSKVLVDKDCDFLHTKNNFRRIFTAFHINFLFSGYLFANYQFMLLIKKISFLRPILNQQLLVPYFALSSLFFFLFLTFFREKIFVKNQSLKDHVVGFAIPELLLGLSFVAGFYFNLSYLTWVLYHIIQWLFLPIPSLMKKAPGLKRLTSAYLLPTVVLFATFFIIYPVDYKKAVRVESIGMNPIPVKTSDHRRISFSYELQYYGAPTDKKQHIFYLEILRLGWFHVISSFILSNLNPSWIRRLIKV